MTAKVFISPSDQNTNPVVGGGSERDLQRKAGAKLHWYLKDVPGVDVRLAPDVDPNVDEYAARVDQSNAWGADLHICLHSNAGEGGTLILTYDDDKARELANDVLRYVAPLTPAKDPGIRDGSQFYELNGTAAVACLVEVDRHDTADGAAVIRRIIEDDSYPLALAKGIVDYLVGNGYIRRPETGFFAAKQPVKDAPAVTKATDPAMLALNLLCGYIAYDLNGRTEGGRTMLLGTLKDTMTAAGIK